MFQSTPKHSRPTGKLADHRYKLCREAEARQAERDRRTPQQQLALLDQRRGSSKRERTKLNKILAGA